MTISAKPSLLVPLLRLACLTAAALLAVRLAMTLTDQVRWELLDFVVAGALLFGVGAVFIGLTRGRPYARYRVAVAVALLSTLALVWGNLAVGVVGAPERPWNLVYDALVLLMAIGALAARGHARAMVSLMAGAALAMAALAAVSLLSAELREPVRTVLLIHGLFAALFVLSAGLFHRAADTA
ncbi:hypothetical protein [Oleiagrimonas sp. C23AA]|uniref:hypothetical protein n=1 Tax=Oleiagrimonas sp. C23AA TaxID=2719047 RepID=UPI001421BA94|nr:hypothetical protein [Oleiagrimonas sp. C23AA]NII10167.1 hypothetical protein [Oleiagrimonas sp. C23AA]